jgi:hypothetical protein
VAHKTGFINESKIDVGLVLSDRANLAIAIFIDKHPDHEEALNNRAFLLAAHVARAGWNFFTGDSGYERVVNERDVDWNQFPGGKWAIYRSPFAPFPHPARDSGFRSSDGTFYPRDPHYSDNSITIFVPDGFTETPEGTNVIVHFHGHRNDNMGVLEQYKMPQAMIATRTNALLVLPQGPYRVPDSFCGKMEDSLGFRNMVNDVMETMKHEGIVNTTAIRSIVVTAHSGGYEPAAFVLDRGGMNDKIADVFLFDAFYGQLDKFREWLTGGKGTMFGAYTQHLAANHQKFEKEVGPLVGNRLHFGPAAVEHNEVVEAFFSQWLQQLDDHWRIHEK